MKRILTVLLSISFATVLCLGCFNPEDYNTISASPEQIVLTKVTSTTVSADGISTAEFQVSIPSKTAFNKRVVVFKTDKGFFVGGKGDSLLVSSPETFMASAQLVSVNTGKATVSAKIQGVDATTPQSVTFVQAYPATIDVSVDSFAVKDQYFGEILITATLNTANGGKPSVGQPVSFTVTKDVGGGGIGDFLNNQPNASTGPDGKARIRFTPGVASYNNYATITAKTVKNAQDDIISNTTRIYIRPK